MPQHRRKHRVPFLNWWLCAPIEMTIVASKNPPPRKKKKKTPLANCYLQPPPITFSTGSLKKNGKNKERGVSRPQMYFWKSAVSDESYFSYYFNPSSSRSPSDAKVFFSCFCWLDALQVPSRPLITCMYYIMNCYLIRLNRIQVRHEDRRLERRLQATIPRFRQDLNAAQY